MNEIRTSPEGLWVHQLRRYNASMRDEDVTFTFLEDGFYLPSIGTVLPEGGVSRKDHP